MGGYPCCCEQSEPCFTDGYCGAIPATIYAEWTATAGASNLVGGLTANATFEAPFASGSSFELNFRAADTTSAGFGTLDPAECWWAGYIDCEVTLEWQQTGSGFPTDCTATIADNSVVVPGRLRVALIYNNLRAYLSLTHVMYDGSHPYEAEATVSPCSATNDFFWSATRFEIFQSFSPATPGITCVTDGLESSVASPITVTQQVVGPACRYYNPGCSSLETYSVPSIQVEVTLDDWTVSW